MLLGVTSYIHKTYAHTKKHVLSTIGLFCFCVYYLCKEKKKCLFDFLTCSKYALPWGMQTDFLGVDLIEFEKRINILVIKRLQKAISFVADSSPGGKAVQ